jgi:hypothetical protein
MLRRKIIIIKSSKEIKKVEIEPYRCAQVHRRPIFLGHINDEHYILLKLIENTETEQIE